MCVVSINGHVREEYMVACIWEGLSKLDPLRVVYQRGAQKIGLVI